MVAENQQVKIYRMARGFKVFLAIGMPLLVTLFGWVMIEVLSEGSTKHSFVELTFLVMISFGCILLFVYIWVLTFIWRLEIHPDKIRDAGLFKTKEIRIDDVKGFRVHQGSQLYIYPQSSNTKKIGASLYIERKSELLEWLDENFKNLDFEDYKEEVEQVLHNPKLGDNENDRLEALEKTKKVARIINGMGLALTLWALFIQEPYQYVMLLLILLPFAVIGVVRYYKGALTLDGNEKSAIPHVTIAFIFPCLGLLLRAVFDFNIFEWKNFWIPFIIIASLFYLLGALSSKGEKNRIVNLIVLIFFAATYGFGAIITLNGILDRTQPSIYRAQILNKRISSGNHTSYYFKLSSWGPRNESNEIDVDKTKYNQYEIGNSVSVVLKKGSLGIPWYYVW